MLLDSIENFFRYATKNDRSLMAYDFIVNYLKKPLPLGRYEILGDDVYANIIEYETAPAEQKDFEMHKRYIDFQFMVAGQEKMYLRSSEQLEAQPYDEATDCAFLKGDSGICQFDVQPNQFAVFYPHEAHKPGCSIDGPETVRKIVVKIAVE